MPFHMVKKLSTEFFIEVELIILLEDEFDEKENQYYTFGILN